MLRRFKPKGNGDVVEVPASDKARVDGWRRESEYYEVDVNGNKMPDFEGLVDFWNQHAAQAKSKKVKE